MEVLNKEEEFDGGNTKRKEEKRKRKRKMEETAPYRVFLKQNNPVCVVEIYSFTRFT